MFIHLFHVGTFFGKYTCFDVHWNGQKKNHNESNYIYFFFHLFSFIETS